MADIGSEVHITGSEYGPWASEMTAIKMSEAIADLVDLSKKQQTDIVNQLKKNGKITEKTAKAIGSEGLKSSLGKDLKEAGDSALNMAGGFDKLNKGPLKNFGAALKKSSLGFKTTLAAVGLLGQAVGVFISTVRESTAAMRDMADSGITIAGGMSELQAGLADVGMTLAEVSEIAGKYGSVMGIHGFRAITQLTKSVNAAGEGFMKYGLTTAEATEFTAEYLEQQRLGGVFQMRRATDQAKAVQDNIERLTAYSKILNVSRKHMMETTTTMMNREDVQARFATMDTEQRERAVKAYEATIQAFTAMGPKGEEFGTMLTDMLGNPVAEASETFRQLAQVSPELARQMADASRGIAEGIPVSEVQVKSMMELAKQNQGALKNMAIQEGAVGQMARKLLAASLIPEQAAATAVKNQEAFEEARRKAQEKGENLSRKEFDESVASNIKTAASLDDALNILKATAISELTQTFLALVGKEGESGIKAAIGGLNDLSGWMKKSGTELRDWIDMIKKSDNPMGEIMKTALKGAALLLEGIGKLIVAAIEKGFAMLSEGSVVNTVLSPFRRLGTEIIDLATGLSADSEKLIRSPEEITERKDAMSVGILGMSGGALMRSVNKRADPVEKAKEKAEAAGTTTREGASTVTPPSTGGAGMTDTEAAQQDLRIQQVTLLKSVDRHLAAILADSSIF